MPNPSGVMGPTDMMLRTLGKRVVLRKEPALAEELKLLKEMVDVWLLKRLWTSFFEESTIIIGEARGNNHFIWEKVVLSAAGLKSFEEIFSEDQFVSYLEKKVYLVSPAKELAEEPPMEGEKEVEAEEQPQTAEKETAEVIAEKDDAQKKQVQEEQTMMEVESEKSPTVQQSFMPHWADSP